MTARVLELPDVLRRRLLHLRLMHGVTEPPTLDAAEVAAAQKALGRPIGDPLLALLANGDDALHAREIRLRSVASLTKELHAAGGPRGLFGIGRRVEGSGLIASPALGTQLHFYDFDAEQPLARTVHVLEWLDELIAREVEALRDVETDEKARAFKKITAEDLEGFRPAITARASGPQVQHAKFGVGEVLRRFDGKVEVRFADGSTRTLLERFLTPVAGNDDE